MKKTPLFMGLVFAFISLNSFGAVDCTLKLERSSTNYRRIDIGAMVSRFSLDVLQAGSIIPQKISLSLSCDGGEGTPATKCTVGFSNVSEPVQVGEFTRAKMMNQVEFSALVPQTVQTQIGDLQAGEKQAQVICTVQ